MNTRSFAALAVLLLVPSLALAQAPADAAVARLTADAAELGLAAADLADMVVVDAYTSAHNGVTHVYVQQRLDGIPVHNGLATVNLRRDGSVLGIQHRFVPGLATVATGRTQALSAADAAAAAAAHLDLAPTGSFYVEEEHRGVRPELLLNPAGIAIEPIRAQLAYERLDSGELRLAWIVGIYTEGARHYWNVSVDAETGAILREVDLVVHDHWGEAGHAHGATRSLAPLRTMLEGAAYEAPVVATAAGGALGGQYRVYGLPLESPTHAGDPFADLRTLESNPADPAASPLGWHDTGATSFTITRGNNVHAYTDTNASNSPDPDGEPDGGSALVFDFPLDLEGAPSAYREAAVANLFYWNNVIHDVVYHYGFDEVAGNFQVNNFGNGGLGNDPVRAEAQDGAGTNNANFFTPPDGSPPRMQMFVWTGRPTVAVTAPEPIAGEYPGGGASFGPELGFAGVTGPIVQAVDDGGSALACNPITTNAGAIAGRIALVDRGGCTFVEKVTHAQNAGAIAVIVVNNTSGVITMGGTGPGVTIPAVMVSSADGATIRSGLPGATADLFALPSRDSDFDNGVIIHEYAHGISNRLTGGPGTTTCLSNPEQAGEGWSDYYALLLTGAGQDSRGIGTYLRFEGVDGGGIRPARYSTDLALNPFTYANVGQLSVPHGVGFVFASMLWDMTADLIAEYGYDPDLYHGSGGNNLALQLVTDGLKMQTCSPGFVDSRDAILLADEALTDGANQCLIWRAFARRGLGYGADQGSPFSVTDGTAAFDLPVACQGVGTEGTGDGPAFGLDPVFPNPVRGAATVRFALAEAGPVSVEVFDVLGRRVALVAEGALPAGRHEVQWETAGLGSGAYLVRLRAGNDTETRRVTVVR